MSKHLLFTLAVILASLGAIEAQQITQPSRVQISAVRPESDKCEPADHRNWIQRLFHRRPKNPNRILLESRRWYHHDFGTPSLKPHEVVVLRPCLSPAVHHAPAAAGNNGKTVNNKSNGGITQ